MLIMIQEVFLAHKDILIKFGVTFIIAFIIGLERELRGKPYGVRTSLLVTGGAMIFTYLSLMMDPNEPARIAAQIVTGIGFLGAGIILVDKSNHIANLTTAASIWFSASVGMLIGFGEFFIAVVGMIFAVISGRLPSLWMEKEIKKTERKVLK
ncbi:MgtC/SapB family protein [Candidatus Pacearchaeota archaeon]|nr:MgtC/SapB family protein [Candidatus Pacearchaeota archaeon]